MNRMIFLSLALLAASPLSAKSPGLTVKAGETVKWTNDEKRASHSIWFKAERLPESERMLNGDSWSRKFDKPGSYPYTCGPHPEMKGVVEVLP